MIRTPLTLLLIFFATVRSGSVPSKASHAGEVRHQEEQRKELAERQKNFDERQKRWDKRDKEWRKQGLFRNPWTQPREIAYLLLTLALVVLSITVYLLARR